MAIMWLLFHSELQGERGAFHLRFPLSASSTFDRPPSPHGLGRLSWLCTRKGVCVCGLPVLCWLLMPAAPCSRRRNKGGHSHLCIRSGSGQSLASPPEVPPAFPPEIPQPTLVCSLLSFSMSDGGRPLHLTVVEMFGCFKI